MIPGYAPRAADAAYAERIAGELSSAGASSSQKQKQKVSLTAVTSYKVLYSTESGSHTEYAGVVIYIN